MARIALAGRRMQLVIAYSVGIVGYLSGLVLSALFDLPSGALIVWTLAGCALFVQLLPWLRWRPVPENGAEDAELSI